MSFRDHGYDSALSFPYSHLYIEISSTSVAAIGDYFPYIGTTLAYCDTLSRLRHWCNFKWHIPCVCEHGLPSFTLIAHACDRIALPSRQASHSIFCLAAHVYVLGGSISAWLWLVGLSYYFKYICVPGRRLQLVMTTELSLLELYHSSCAPSALVAQVSGFIIVRECRSTQWIKSRYCFGAESTLMLSIYSRQWQHHWYYSLTVSSTATHYLRATSGPCLGVVPK